MGLCEYAAQVTIQLDRSADAGALAKMNRFLLFFLFMTLYFPLCGASGIAANETFCDVSADECAYVNAAYGKGGLLNRCCQTNPTIKSMMRARYKNTKRGPGLPEFWDGCDALKDSQFVKQVKSLCKIKDQQEAGTCIDCDRSVRADAPVPRAVRESREIRDFTREREPDSTESAALGDFFSRGGGEQLLSVLSGPLAPQEVTPVSPFEESLNPFSTASNAPSSAPFSALASPPQTFPPYYQPANYRPVLPDYGSRAALENFGYSRAPQTQGYNLGGGHIYNGGSFPAQFPNHTSFLKFH